MGVMTNITSIINVIVIINVNIIVIIDYHQLSYVVISYCHYSISEYYFYHN